MKKIISFMFLATLLFVAGACSSDDLVGSKSMSENIQIDSASINFTDAPGTGRISVTAAKGLSSVESSDSWCTASIEGSTIVVNVTQNLALTGRAAVLTIHSGDDTRAVTVQQLGLPHPYFNGDSTLFIGYAASDFTIPVVSPAGYPITANSDADWLTVTMTDGVAQVKVAANTTHRIRNGKITLTSGPRADKLIITVVQRWDASTVMNGWWQLCFYTTADTEGQTPQQWDVKIEGDSMLIDYGTDGHVGVPIKYNTSTGQLSIRGAVRCSGKYKGNTPILYFETADENVWSGAETNSLITGSVVADDNDNLRIDLSGNVYSSRYTFGAFFFAFYSGTFSGFPANPAVAAEMWPVMFHPYLYKAAASSAAPSRF